MPCTRTTRFRFPKHTLRSIAILLLVALGCNHIAYPAPKDGRRPDPQAIHRQLSNRGLGKGVKVTRLDGSTVRGHIAALDDAMVEVQPPSGPAITIPLADVKKVSKTGFPTAAKIGLGVFGGLLVVGVIGTYIVFR